MGDCRHRRARSGDLAPSMRLMEMPGSSPGHDEALHKLDAMPVLAEIRGKSGILQGGASPSRRPSDDGRRRVMPAIDPQIFSIQRPELDRYQCLIQRDVIVETYG